MIVWHRFYCLVARVLCTWLTLAAFAASPAGAADDFYAGKTIDMLIGLSSGGGYDIYGRTLARYLGRHIPGNPQIVPQNMPGAGSLKLVNYLYNVAPKDGAAIGIFAPGVIAQPLLGHAEGAQFDATKFGWLGSVSEEISVCAYMASTGIASVQDMRTKPTVIGASAAAPKALCSPPSCATCFTCRSGSLPVGPGGAEITLAMQRHEVDGRCGWSWTSLVSRNKAMLTAKDINVTLQFALSQDNDPNLAGVPLIVDLTKDPAERAALKLIVSRQNMARPFAVPPGVPPARLAMLRDAFDATMKDPDFLAEAHSADLEVRPVTGAAVEALIKDIYASPPEAIKLATDAMQAKP